MLTYNMDVDPQSYCTAPGQRRWHHFWVHLDGAGVAAMEGLLIPDKKLTPVPLAGVRMKELSDTVLTHMEGGTVDSMMETSLSLHEMLILCARGRFSQTEAKEPRQVILRSAEILRRNYREELCLADLLEEAHMSKSYFLRLFRRYIGTTPYHYLVNYRITQAKELLVLTDRNISDIARDVGFGDACNFSTRFSAVTGESPAAYRKSALKSVLIPVPAKRQPAERQAVPQDLPEPSHGPRLRSFPAPCSSEPPEQ